MLSWLANINANKVGTPEQLKDHAASEIGKALADNTLKPILSEYFPGIKSETENPIFWGPYSYSHDPTNGNECVTDNAVYMIKGVDNDSTTNKKSLYVIAVSGTNPDSHFGWYREDFLPEDLVAWPCVGEPSGDDNPKIDPLYNPYTGTLEGGVSSGFALGLDILWNRMDQFANLNNEDAEIQLLFPALKEAIENDANDNIEIAVTGHSLGGALSPMLALAIKQNFDKIQGIIPGKTITVSTWPTAGPTPGEANFAKYLTEIIGDNNYKGVYNALDIVPHGFNPQMMAELDNFYQDSKVDSCFDHPEKVQETTQLTHNLLAYAKTLPKNHDYQLSQGGGTHWTSIFKPAIVDPKSTNPITNSPYAPCGKIRLFITWAMLDVAFWRPAFNTIYNEHPHDIYLVPRNAINNLFGYLIQAGIQHTTAYVEQYFSTGEAQALASYMSQKIQGEETATLSPSEKFDLANFKTLIKNAWQYYKANPQNYLDK